jgi:hypothetical protein
MKTPFGRRPTEVFHKPDVYAPRVAQCQCADDPTLGQLRQNVELTSQADQVLIRWRLFHSVLSLI